MYLGRMSFSIGVLLNWRAGCRNKVCWAQGVSQPGRDHSAANPETEVKEKEGGLHTVLEKIHLLIPPLRC